MHLSPSHLFGKGLISSLWLDQLAWCVLLQPTREHSLMVSGCLQTHDKIPLSALQSNLDCARRNGTGFHRCVLHKAESDRKTTHTSLFYSLVCQWCVMLYPLHCCHGKWRLNIWSDGVPGMAGYWHWVRLLCKTPLLSLLFGRSRTKLQYDSSAEEQTSNDKCTLFNRQRKYVCEKYDHVFMERKKTKSGRHTSLTKLFQPDSFNDFFLAAMYFCIKYYDKMV